MTERAELREGRVIRVFKGSIGIGPYAEGLRDGDFFPTSEDKRIAEETGSEVLLSVFDRERATPLQCAAIRGLSIPFHAWALNVDSIRRIKAPERPEALSVVCDALPHPQCLQPGASGHCGIRGLGKYPGETRKRSQLIIAYLAGQLKDWAFEEPIV
jgi:hypothetical protein